MRILYVIVLVVGALAGSCDCTEPDWGPIWTCQNGRQATHAGNEVICYIDGAPTLARPWMGADAAAPDDEQTACDFCDGIYNPDGGAP